VQNLVTATLKPTMISIVAAAQSTNDSSGKSYANMIMVSAKSGYFVFEACLIRNHWLDISS
jgi:hypothetical protein